MRSDAVVYKQAEEKKGNDARKDEDAGLSRMLRHWMLTALCLKSGACLSRTVVA